MATTRFDIFERARLARDSRFDGQFFIGVKTTGIYCRPICPANPPKPENVSFFPTAAAAAEAGFRPCLRCRPEAAPGTPAWAGTSTTVNRGLRLISHGALDSGTIETLSDRLGVSSRHLRRLFQRHLGASPQAVAHTQRLHFAKRLIDETHLPLNHIAEAAGYGSIRRFNDAFLKCYGRPPRALRKLREETPDTESRIALKLSYLRPYDWSRMLAFIDRRATHGVEVVRTGQYHRSILIDGNPALLSVSNEERSSRLKVELTGVATSALFQVVQRIREMFDVDAPIEDIRRVLRLEPLFQEALARRPGIRVPGAWDGFELAVRAILGQQISVAAATTLAGRLASTWGEPLAPPLTDRAAGLTHLFPTPLRLANARLEDIGVVRTRADTIRLLASSVAEGKIDFDLAEDSRAFAEKLTAIRGIGEWTAQYVLMRAMKYPDAFPSSDLGLLKAVEPSRTIRPRQLEERAEDWRPWRAYAAMLLWTEPEISGG